MKSSHRILILTGVLLLLVWVLFFDSHSVWKRYQLHRNHQEQLDRNTRLTSQIEEIEEKLKDVDSDEAIEKAAREQYDMRRDGETVYPIENKK